MSTESIPLQGGEAITADVEHHASSHSPIDGPSGSQTVGVPFLPPASVRGQDGGTEADPSGRVPAVACLFCAQVHLITELLPSTNTVTLGFLAVCNYPQGDSNHELEVSVSLGRPPGNQAEVPSTTSLVVSNVDLDFLHASVLQEQQQFLLHIYQPVQAARMRCTNLLGRVCEAYLVWTLNQLENATAPRLALLRGWETWLTIISHSLTSIQLSVEGINIQSSHILRILVMAIASQPGPGPSASWTTRMNRLLLNYEERGLNLASQIARLADVVLPTRLM